MIWTVCFIISILFAAAGIFFCRLAAVSGRGASSLQPRHGILPDDFSPMLLLSAGLLFAIAALAFPVYRAGRTALEDIAAAFLSSLRVIVLGEDFSVMRAAASEAGGAFANVYLAYGAVLFVAQPISTTLFLLSLFKSLALWARYRFLRGKNVYVFSSINEYTLSIARSILQDPKVTGNGRATVVFADSGMEDAEYGPNRYAAKRMGALCFKRNIGSMDLRPAPKRKYSLMLFGPDEYDNLRVSLELAKRYEDRSDMELTVLASTEETELLVDAKRKELFSSNKPTITFSCVNDTNAVIYELLDTHPLFGNTCLPDAGPISVLLVGGDVFIKELFKSVCWCGQMDGRGLKVRVADAEAARLENELRLECPELFTAKKQGGEPEYDIAFLNVDVHTDELHECIASCGDATYIVAAPGDDTLNIQTAVTMRTLYQRLRGGRETGLPDIFVRVQDEWRNELASRLSSFEQGDGYRLVPFGGTQSTCRYTALAGSPYQRIAKAMHGNDAFYSEYDKKSKIARLMHLRYQVYQVTGDPRYAALPVAQWSAADVDAMIAAIEPDAAKVGCTAYDNLSELRRNACRLEHRRWNAYMRSEGYVYPGRPGDDELKVLITQRGWQKNHLAKTHLCIVPWEDDSGASELERYSAMGIGGSGYRDYDDVVSELIKVRDALLSLSLGS